MNLFFEAKKDELRGKGMDYLGFQGRRCDHKTLSDTEVLEKYNRWENIGITGIKKTELTRVCWVQDENLLSRLQDISTANRLSLGGRGPKPIIVKFSRRIAKVKILRQKNVGVIQKAEDYSFYGWSQFLELMRNDEWLKKFYAIEGSMFYSVKGHQRSYKATSICVEVGCFWSIL